MANKIDGEDIYQIGINELAEKSSVDVTDVVPIQQSVGGVVQKKSVGAIVEKAQAQADWNEADNTKADFIKNKPTIPAAQIQSDWNQGDNTKLDFIKNKPTIPSVGNREIEIQKNGTKVDSFTTNESGSTKKTINITVPTTAADVHALPDSTVIPDAQIQSDWNQSDNTKKDYIKNKPTIPAAQIQSDWSQADNTKLDFIKNKPSIPTVNNSTITITQGGVTKGTFTLNQSSAQTIALDAGGGIVIQVVDTICYEEPNSAVPISQAECFDIANNYFIYLSGGDTWAEDTTIPVVDGMIIYAIFEDAYYIYDSSYGLKPLSKGKSSIETDFDGSYYYINGYLPITDSFGEIELTAFTMPGSSCYLNLNGMFTTVPTEFFEESIGKTHTICIYNSKSTDVDITINNLYLTTKQGFISSGLDSNQSFTVKAGEFAEVNIMFQDSGIQSAYYGNLNNALASIIVKTDFDVNFQSIS